MVPPWPSSSGVIQASCRKFEETDSPQRTSSHGPISWARKKQNEGGRRVRATKCHGCRIDSGREWDAHSGRNIARKLSMVGSQILISIRGPATG
jgi:hypothetical protein